MSPVQLKKLQIWVSKLIWKKLSNRRIVTYYQMLILSCRSKTNKDKSKRQNNDCHVFIFIFKQFVFSENSMYERGIQYWIGECCDCIGHKLKNIRIECKINSKFVNWFLYELRSNVYTHAHCTHAQTATRTNGRDRDNCESKRCTMLFHCRWCSHHHEVGEHKKLCRLMMLMKMEFKLIFDSMGQWDIYLFKLIINFVHVQLALPD